MPSGHQPRTGMPSAEAVPLVGTWMALQVAVLSDPGLLPRSLLYFYMPLSRNLSTERVYCHMTFMAWVLLCPCILSR